MMFFVVERRTGPQWKPSSPHAETTVRSALVWGAIQALAVVAGFVLLGRLLELRGPRSAHAHAIVD